jgi:hypothetical protein
MRTTLAEVMAHASFPILPVEGITVPCSPAASGIAAA